MTTGTIEYLFHVKFHLLRNRRQGNEILQDTAIAPIVVL